MSLTINLCVCRNISFSELLSDARRQGWNLEELVRRTGCGAGCGLCRPYLRRMLETGETIFREILTD
ncbi:MAG TPA: (2Fe-2S)-binding protein [Gemmatimonadales bacterium]|nr:(2Fe-2S)-binding protein [Gemmatimonadales bacterium]